MSAALRRIILAIAAVIVGALVAVVVYATSVQPGAAAVRVTFQARTEVSPPAEYDEIAATVREVHGIHVAVAGAPDARLDVYVPRSPVAAARPVVLWIHGGGFVSSSADTVKDYVTMLAARGYVVANLDYSLAPEARYPVPVEQANAALGYLQAHAAEVGGDPTRVFVGGDSAGAQIASQVAAVQTDAAFAATVGIVRAMPAKRLRGVILFCGFYDMRTVGVTGFPALRTFLWSYTGARDWTAFPRIDELSTTKTASAAYPRTFITVGDADPFRSQAAELTRALRSRGVSVTAVTWAAANHLGHEYQFDFSRSQARTAFSKTLAFLRAGGGS